MNEKSSCPVLRGRDGGNTILLLDRITPEQLTQIKPKLAAPLEAKAEQASTTPAKSEIQPDQTSQKDVEQQEHKYPKQGTDAAH